MSDDVPDPDDDDPESEQHPASDDVPESEGNPAPDDISESEQAEYEAAPADWRELATRPVEQLEREMRELHRVWDRHSYIAWLSVMQVIPRVRAFKEHVGGDAFHERCRRSCRIGKTAAGNIVRWKIAEPKILNKIWERVHAEAHAASVRGDRYEYPTLHKMCGWYEPEDEVPDDTSEEDEEELQNLLTGAGSEEPSKDSQGDEEHGNDPRSKAEIAKQNIMLEDHNKTLTRKQTLLEQRLADRDVEIDQLSRRANDQRERLAQLRELITELKAEIAAKDDEIAAKDAEIARLRAEAVTQKQTDEPEPDPEPPEPPPQASQPVPEPEPDTERAAQPGQPVIEPEPEPEPQPDQPPLLLLPTPTPPPELPDLDDLDDEQPDQPDEPDDSQPGPDIQAAIERLRANPHIRAQETYRRIMGTRLPRVRKLARVQQLIAEMYDGVLNSREIDFARFWDDYGEGIDFIRRAIKTDSPKFSKMGTFKDYLDLACALAGDEAAKEKGPR